MRDASQLESDSVNSYVSSISVDTGTSFYDRRSDGRVSRGDRMLKSWWCIYGIIVITLITIYLM